MYQIYCRLDLKKGAKPPKASVGSLCAAVGSVESVIKTSPLNGLQLLQMAKEEKNVYRSSRVIEHTVRTVSAAYCVNCVSSASHMQHTS